MLSSYDPFKLDCQIQAERKDGDRLEEDKVKAEKEESKKQREKPKRLAISKKRKTT